MRRHLLFLLLILPSLYLTGCGLAMLASFSGHREDLIIKQALWAGCGLCAFFLFSLIDYKKLRSLWPPLLLGSCMLLICCYIPGIKKEVNGSSRWIEIPGLTSFQPSEFAKIVVILSLGAWFSFQRAHTKTLFKGFIFPGVIIGVPFLLILLETDMGTALGLALSGAIVFFLAGVRLRYLFASLVLGLCAGGGIAFNKVEYKERITTFWDYKTHNNYDHDEKNFLLYSQGEGFQQIRSQYALGSGGLYGVGLGKGIEKEGYLPESHTDFIFPAIGEEMGFYALWGIVLSFLCMSLAGLAIACNSNELFGKLLSAGLTSIITIPALINMAVSTSLFPNTGLPLPFVSYGGTNIFATLCAMGMILSVYKRSSFRLVRENSPLSSSQHSPFS